MKKIILLIIWFLILLNISNVYWCSCSWESTPEESYKYADAIFIGKVINQEEIIEKRDRSDWWYLFQLMWDIKYLIITFETSENIKWDKNIYQIRTDAMNSSCYRSFLKNREYFVYAYWKWEILWTSFCSRTRELIYAKEDIEAFEWIKINKFNYFILMLKVYKNFVYGIGIWIFFLIYGYVIYKSRQYKKLKLLKSIWKK
jgi:hypothetical protein